MSRSSPAIGAAAGQPSERNADCKRSTSLLGKYPQESIGNIYAQWLTGRIDKITGKTEKRQGQGVFISTLDVCYFLFTMASVSFAYKKCFMCSSAMQSTKNILLQGTDTLFPHIIVPVYGISPYPKDFLISSSSCCFSTQFSTQPQSQQTQRMTGILPNKVIVVVQMLLPLAWRLGWSGTRTIFLDWHLGQHPVFFIFILSLPSRVKCCTPSAIRQTISQEPADRCRQRPLSTAQPAEQDICGGGATNRFLFSNHGSGVSIPKSPTEWHFVRQTEEPFPHGPV